MLPLSQIKLCMGHVNKYQKKKKIKILIFEWAKLDFLKKNANAKKNIFLITLLCISKEAARWVDFSTENQIKNFYKLTELQLHM